MLSSDNDLPYFSRTLHELVDPFFWSVYNAVFLYATLMSHVACFWCQITLIAYLRNRCRVLYGREYLPKTRTLFYDSCIIADYMLSHTMLITVSYCCCCCCFVVHHDNIFFNWLHFCIFHTLIRLLYSLSSRHFFFLCVPSVRPVSSVAM